MKPTFIGYSLAIFALLVGCTKTPLPLESDPFVGKFGTIQNGVTHPAFKIDHTPSGYVFSYFYKGRWLESDQIAKQVSAEMFEKELAVKPPVPFHGLTDHILTFIKVNPGFTAGDFTTPTGYIIYTTQGGPLSIVKL